MSNKGEQACDRLSVFPHRKPLPACVRRRTSILGNADDRRGGCYRRIIYVKHFNQGRAKSLGGVTEAETAKNMAEAGGYWKVYKYANDYGDRQTHTDYKQISGE